MKTKEENKLSIDKELLQLWRLCNGLEEDVKAVKKSIKRVETARYQQKQELSQPEKKEEEGVFLNEKGMWQKGRKEEPEQFTREELDYLKSK